MKRFKNLCTTLLAVVLIMASTPVTSADPSLTLKDMSGHWAEKTVKELLSANIIQKMSPTTFEPDVPITRADFVAFLSYAFDLETRISLIADRDFTDIHTHPRKHEIQLATHFGIVTGYPDGTFKPERTITREEAAVLLYKALQLNYPDKLSSNTTTMLNTFSDWTNVSSWSKESVEHLYLKNMINGFQDLKFKPQNTMTRAEASALLMNYINSLINITGNTPFGPEKETLTIQKDVFVSSKTAHLRNLKIDGRLIITEKVGKGNVVLENIEVTKETIIRGGGIDSIHVIGGHFEDFIIEETASGDIRIVSNSPSGLSIRISSTTSNQRIILSGQFNQVQVESTNAKIETQPSTLIKTFEIDKEAHNNSFTLASNSIIENVRVNSTTQFSGTGVIKVANVNANDVQFNTKPETLIIASTVSSLPKINIESIPVVSAPPPVTEPTTEPVTEPTSEPLDEASEITGTLGETFLTGSTRNVYLASGGVQNDLFSLNIKKYEADEIWALPILGDDFGLWLTDIFSNKVVFPIENNGQFKIALDSLDQTQNYVFILVDTTLNDKKDHIQGFVALQNKSSGNNLIMMPVHDLKSGLKLGLLNRIGIEAVTELGIQETSDHFKTLTVEKLLELAESANALKALKNFYINFNEETGEQYSYNLEYSFDMGQLDFGAYSNYVSEYLNGFSVYVRTNRGTSTPKYFRPTGPYIVRTYNENYEYTGDETYGPSRPFQAGISYDGGYEINQYYSYFTPFTNNTIAPGYWLFEDAAENVLGYFDFSMTPFIDDNEQPLGYIPSLRISLDENTIQTLDVKWFHSNGDEVREATDPNMIKSAVKGTYFNHWNSQSFSIGNSIGIPFAPESRVYLSDLHQAILESSALLQSPEALDEFGERTPEAQSLLDAVLQAETHISSMQSRLMDIRTLPGIQINTKGFGVAYTFAFGNPAFDPDMYEAVHHDNSVAIQNLITALTIYQSTLIE